jgi:hypothetical protein
LDENAPLAIKYLIHCILIIGQRGAVNPVTRLVLWVSASRASIICGCVGRF